MKAELLSNYVKDFFVSSEWVDLDPEVYLNEIERVSVSLSNAVDLGEKQTVFWLMSELLFNQLCFNCTIVGPFQLGLIPESRKERMEKTIQESDAVYQKAVEYVGEKVDLFDLFKRYHNRIMGVTETFNVKDLL